MTQTASQSGQKLTPMLQQYVDLKKQYQECLLLFRLGDFYEMFFEDATQAAPALDIVLTRRGRKDGEDIPMCGIPFHAAESYMARLIQKGFKVAICEQMESPEEAKKRGYKAVVRRDVVRIITPGTLTEENLLTARENNFLVGLGTIKGSLALAAVDISTGDFFLEPVNEKSLEAALVRLNPKEILISHTLSGTLSALLTPWSEKLSLQSDSRFDLTNAQRTLLETFKVKTLDGFGQFSKAEQLAGGALLDYVSLTQRGKLPTLLPPKKVGSHSHLQIDGSTRQSLELTRTLKGDFQGSLLHAIDRTLTAGGARLLNQRLSTPLMHLPTLRERLDTVDWFLAHEKLLEETRTLLKGVGDLERVFARLSLGRGGPRDLDHVLKILEAAQKIQTLLLGHPLTSSLEKDHGALGPHQDLLAQLQCTLGETLPLLARDGGFVASGFAPELDELRALRDEGKGHIAALQARYGHETGISSLKVKHNHVLGYYIEVTAMHGNKMGDPFIHRQTLANSMRFTTVELSELEQKLSSAADQALALELRIFEDLLATVLAHGEPLSKVAKALASLDVSSSLAFLSLEQNYVRPALEESRTFLVEGGRHPVVERALSASHDTFTPNDCSLNDGDTFWLLTGPNMAGKSTFLRQNALIIILAQMGSHVPAKSARIGLVDKLFSRVGASDELAKGHSTFMVEMVETASILNQSTDRSFVILDEIGRGTSTHDGLSLAWATAEYLHTVLKSRTLFATHYHELSDLENTLQTLSCHTIKVKEWEETIIFLHEVIKGTADRSYGIHVAELAGLPRGVIERAKVLLHSLEHKAGERPQLQGELPLFTPPPPPKDHEVVSHLKALNVDDLSPREALGVLYDLKDKC